MASLSASLSELTLLDEDLLKGHVEFLLASPPVRVFVDGPHSLLGLLLVKSGGVAHLLEDIVEELCELSGVEGPAAISVVFLEDALNELLQL